MLSQQFFIWGLQVRVISHTTTDQRTCNQFLTGRINVRREFTAVLSASTSVRIGPMSGRDSSWIPSTPKMPNPSLPSESCTCLSRETIDLIPHETSCKSVKEAIAANPTFDFVDVFDETCDSTFSIFGPSLRLWYNGSVGRNVKNFDCTPAYSYSPPAA